jgi:hypothetical protein
MVKNIKNDNVVTIFLYTLENLDLNIKLNVTIGRQVIFQLMLVNGSNCVVGGYVVVIIHLLKSPSVNDLS